MAMKRLTIAIPTYNRNELLLRLVNKLSAQITDEVELLILDNASDTPVETTLAGCSALDVKGMKIIRHAFNVGGNENILRCFEHASAAYVWLFGDDDLPTDGSVQMVLGDIQGLENPTYINYHSESPGHISREHEIHCRGVDSLLQNAQSIGQLMFISACVFNRSKLAKGIKHAHFHQGSCAPQLVSVLMSMNDSDLAVLSNKIVSANGADSTPRDLQTNILPVAIGLPKLLDLPLSIGQKERLTVLLTRTQTTWITVRGVLAELYEISLIEGRIKEAQWFYKRLSVGLFSQFSSWQSRIEFLAGYLFISFPNVFIHLVEFVYYRAKKQSFRLRARGNNSRL